MAALVPDDIDRWSGLMRYSVERYRCDHPDTELSDDDIVRSLADYLVDCGVMKVKNGFYVLVGSER